MLHRSLRLLLLLPLLAAAAPAAHAGDLAVGVVLGGGKGRVSLHLGKHHPRHAYPHRGCAVHARCVPAKAWVPGRYETVERRVWVPERHEKVWREPVYETRRDACGRVVRVLVRPGGWTRVVHRGHYEVRCDRVWVPGGYETRCATY